MRSLTITYKEALGPIFSSVYVTPGVELKKFGVDVSIASISTPGHFLRPSLRRQWIARQDEVTRRLGHRVIRVAGDIGRRSGGKAERLLCAEQLRLRGALSGISVIHGGGSLATLIGIAARAKMPHVKIVNHVWGPDEAEILYGAGSNQKERERARVRGLLQRESISGADLVVSISRKMTEWLRQDYSVGQEKILEMPCVVDCAKGASSAKSRDLTRQELGYTVDDVAVGYCGSMLPWQLPPATELLLRSMRRVFAGPRFLGLTQHPAALERLLESVGWPRNLYTVLSVPHDRVSKYLAALDLGIVGRGLGEPPSLVHRVSSPIKFGEYLSVGTPVVMGNDVGDFSDETTKNCLGIVIDDIRDSVALDRRLARFLESYVSDRAGSRARCMLFAASQLDGDLYFGPLAKAYMELSQGK